MSRMKNFLTIIFVTFLSKSIIFLTTIAEASDECKEIGAKSPATRLRRYLFCDYEWTRLPNSDKNSTVNVTLVLAPKLANFDEFSGNLELYTWMYITWEDEQLSWEPSSFEDVREINVWSSEIWVPEIAVQSPGNDDTNENGLSHVSCELMHGGRVGCSPRVHQSIRCRTDFTLWPYDRQNCTLMISSWAHTGKQIAFTLSGRSNRTVFMEHFISNGEWQVAVSRVFIEPIKPNHFANLTSSKISIDFILDRAQGQLSGRYVTPGMIMIVMTLTTLWLDPRSHERLAVGCLNPVIHLMCIQDLHWVLPHNGNTIPNILLFYTNSFIMAIGALLLTFFLKKLHETKISAPKWLSSSTTLILRSKVGQIFLLSMLDPKAASGIEPDAEDNADLVDSELKEPTWGYTVVLLGWISFIVFFLTYMIMWAVMIPNSSMRPPIIDIGLQ